MIMQLTFSLSCFLNVVLCRKKKKSLSGILPRIIPKKELSFNTYLLSAYYVPDMPSIGFFWSRIFD